MRPRKRSTVRTTAATFVERSPLTSRIDDDNGEVEAIEHDDEEEDEDEDDDDEVVEDIDNVDCS